MPLKWTKGSDRNHWVSRDAGNTYEVRKSEYQDRHWFITRNSNYIGQHQYVDGAKRIAQWCADASPAGQP